MRINNGRKIKVYEKFDVVFICSICIYIDGRKNESEKRLDQWIIN